MVVKSILKEPKSRDLISNKKQLDTKDVSDDSGGEIDSDNDHIASDGGDLDSGDDGTDVDEDIDGYEEADSDGENNGDGDDDADADSDVDLDSDDTDVNDGANGYEEGDSDVDLDNDGDGDLDSDDTDVNDGYEEADSDGDLDSDGDGDLDSDDDIDNGNGETGSESDQEDSSAKKPVLTSVARMSNAMTSILGKSSAILSEVNAQTKPEKAKIPSLEIVQSDGKCEKLYEPEPEVKTKELMPKNTRLKSFKYEDVCRKLPDECDPKRERRLRLVTTQGVLSLFNELERARNPKVQTEEEAGKIKMFNKKSEIGAITHNKKGDLQYLSAKRKPDRDIFEESVPNKKSKEDKEVSIPTDKPEKSNKKFEKSKKFKKNKK